MTKRVVIFAGYNRKSKIEDYVLYYLSGLRKVTDTLIYVADNVPNEIYRLQLKGIVDNIIFEKHGEYDFGSWKRGLRLAARLSLFEDADELILCNDSCYGPVFPFANMFARMKNSAGDFWGITKNCSGDLEHVQSYFLVFRRQVFTSALFKSFFESVTREKTFWDVVSKYEVGLSRLLIEKGNFRFDVYCPVDAGRYNPSCFSGLLLKANSPLIKRKTFTLGEFCKQSKLKLIYQIPNRKIKKFMMNDYFAFFFKRLIHFLFRFLYQSKITKSGHRIIKICKIPLLSISKHYDI